MKNRTLLFALSLIIVSLSFLYCTKDEELSKPTTENNIGISGTDNIFNSGTQEFDCDSSFLYSWTYTMGTDTFSCEKYGIYHNVYIDYISKEDTTGYGVDTLEGMIDFLNDKYYSIIPKSRRNYYHRFRH